MPVWSSCSFHCKTELELVPPHIYVWRGVCKWKENLCSQQARWRTAFTHTYLSELSMWRDDGSSSTKGMVCRRNLYSGFWDFFLVPFWSSCSFHCKIEFELVLPHIYVWSEFCTWKDTFCSLQVSWKTISHTLISQNWACGETFVHLAQRERIAGETFTLVSQSVACCRFEVPAVFTVKPSWS